MSRHRASEPAPTGPQRVTYAALSGALAVGLGWLLWPQPGQEPAPRIAVQAVLPTTTTAPYTPVPVTAVPWPDLHSPAISWEIR